MGEGKKFTSQDGVIGREGHDASVSLATSKRGKREKKGSRIRARGIENNSRTSATKEVDHYRKKREASIQDIRENYYRKHRHERVVCDGGNDDGEGDEGLDVIDALKGA